MTFLRNPTEVLRTPGWDTVPDTDYVSEIQWLLMVFRVLDEPDSSISSVEVFLC